MRQTNKHSLLFIFLTVLTVTFSWNQKASALETHLNINGPFTSISDITKECLKCHHQEALEVLQSTHWNWISQRTINGKNTLFAKTDSLSGFAVDVLSNPDRCMGCHVSNSRPDVNLKTPAPEMVDCIVCHDTTGIYRQVGLSSLNSDKPEILTLMARSVGVSRPGNCMTCHFADCGLPATNTSAQTMHGNAPRLRDYHLDNATPSFSCQTCHTRHNGHGFSRKVVKQNDPSAAQGCQSCHTASPHVLEELNSHVATIACQTCHIPEYAQQNPIIISWNWLLTGKTNRIYQAQTNGRNLVLDENGFTSARQLEPVYLWDDGNDLLYTRGQRIRPGEITNLQKPAERNKNSKIAPFRIIYGTQMYDAKYRYLVSPLLQSSGTVFDPDSDWTSIAKQGMESIVLPFSGQYSFASTARYQRINHGIAPVNKALGCVDCHGANSRMPWKELGYDEDPLLKKQSQADQEKKPGSSKVKQIQLQNYNQLSRR